MGVMAAEMSRIFLRPNVSLKVPDKKAPMMPATSMMESDTPANHKLDPASVMYTGRKVVNAAVIIERVNNNSAIGIIIGHIFAVAPAQLSFVTGFWACASNVRNLKNKNKDVKIPPNINHGNCSIVMKPSAVTITIGPKARPNSPPTIQKPVLRPILVPAKALVKTGPTACNEAELKPAINSKNIRKPWFGAMPSILIIAAVTDGIKIIR